MSDCLFCKIAAGELPAKIIYSDEQLVVFEDIQPQAPHHLVITSYSIHYTKLYELTSRNPSSAKPRSCAILPAT